MILKENLFSNNKQVGEANSDVNAQCIQPKIACAAYLMHGIIFNLCLYYT